MTIELPDEVLSRVQAEATRRGISVDEVIAELAETLPSVTGTERAQHRFSFTGVAASGDGTLSENYKTIRRAEFAS